MVAVLTSTFGILMHEKVKQILLLIISYLFYISAAYSQAEITLENSVHDFDTIPYCSNGHCSFKFKNTGTEPLMITDCRTSDGGFICMMFPTEPVKPNETAAISFYYDTKRVGKFRKSATITTNARNSVVSVIAQGYVKPASNVFPSSVKNE